MSTTHGIKLYENTISRLKSLAEKRNRSPHWLMKDAVDKYLAEAEVYEAEKSEDMARWEQYLITGKAVDHVEVEPWLRNLTNNQYEPWQR